MCYPIDKDQEIIINNLDLNECRFRVIEFIDLLESIQYENNWKDQAPENGKIYHADNMYNWSDEIEVYIPEENKDEYYWY